MMLVSTVYSSYVSGLLEVFGKMCVCVGGVTKTPGAVSGRSVFLMLAMPLIIIHQTLLFGKGKGP